MFLLTTIFIIVIVVILGKVIRQKLKKNCNQSKKLNIGVIVLGEIERSPRMLYHIDSLLKIDDNLIIDVFCYNSDPIFLKNRYDTNNQNLYFHILYNSEYLVSKMPQCFQFVVKAILQSIVLFWYLFLSRKINVFLIQNPPSIPTIPICILYCILFGKQTKMIIDWHNYGHSIIALKIKAEKSLITQLYKLLEMSLGKFSHKNLTVTEGMKLDLIEKYGFIEKNIVVFPDYPAPIFKPFISNIKSKYDNLVELYNKYNIAIYPNEMLLSNTAILISSTSWTEDENFETLLKGLSLYDNHCVGKTSYPYIHCIVTGKGPLKSYYVNRIQKCKFSKVKIDTCWLSYADYANLLRLATLGISLHESSSGIDFPMKIVDMFGSGLPVCAVNFNCLRERLIDDQNGLIFDSFTEKY